MHSRFLCWVSSICPSRSTVTFFHSFLCPGRLTCMVTNRFPWTLAFRWALSLGIPGKRSKGERILRSRYLFFQTDSLCSHFKLIESLNIRSSSSKVCRLYIPPSSVESSNHSFFSFLPYGLDRNILITTNSLVLP